MIRLLPLMTLSLAACGGGGATTSTSAATSSSSSTAIVDPAALYCAGVNGTVIQRVAAGRRADLCRLPDGRTVSTADLVNSHNNL